MSKTLLTIFCLQEWTHVSALAIPANDTLIDLCSKRFGEKVIMNLWAYLRKNNCQRIRQR